MKDQDLDQLLKSAPPPRTESYWTAFPDQVVARLPLQVPAPHPARVATPLGLRIFGGLVLGLGAACLAVGIFIGVRERSGSGDLARLAAARKCYQEVAGLFPNQVRAIIFDESGPHLLLAEKANVPSAPPLFLNLCQGTACKRVVTFSGQKIPFRGESCEVLADARGQVMLVGQDHVWSEHNASGDVRIDASPLGEGRSL